MSHTDNQNVMKSLAKISVTQNFDNAKIWLGHDSNNILFAKILAMQNLVSLIWAINQTAAW